MRERRNIATFNADQLSQLRDAVQLMQARPASDPASWNYLAAVHRYVPFKDNAEARKAGVPEALLQSIDFDALGSVAEDERLRFWNKCIHRDKPLAGHFLSWHRLYLWHFETALLDAVREAATAAGIKPTVVGLPYWDYYGTPLLPAAFRAETVAGKPNSLFVEYRNGDLNAGDAGIPPFALDAFKAGDTLKAAVAIDGQSLKGFSGALEWSPHDKVHGQIGGLMGSVPTAAWDPIFWLHHANLDRFWAIWQARTAAVADASLSTAWKGQMFSFKTDSAGRMFESSAGDALGNTGFAAQGFSYDSLVPPPDTPATALPAAPPLISAPASKDKKMSPNALTLNTQAVSVTNRGGTIELDLPASSGKALKALGTGAPPPPGVAALTWAAVVLDDVKATKAGLKDGFVYQLYLNLPKTPGAAADHDAHLIGSLNAFTLSCADPDVCGSGKQTLRFPITDKLKKLMAKPFGAGRVTVSLVRATALGNDGKPLPPKASAPLLEIGSMRLEGSSDPTM